MNRKNVNGYRYKNLTFLLLSTIAAVFLLKNDAFHAFLLNLGNFTFIGAFVAGFFWVSTFSIFPASIVLFILTDTLPIWIVALTAGLGAVVGDVIILHVIRDTDITSEIMTIFKKFGGRKLTHILHSKHFRWTWPLIGALIIVSPFPDELGVSLMGLSKIKTPYFLLISYLLNMLGILLLLLTSSVIKP